MKRVFRTALSITCLTILVPGCATLRKSMGDSRGAAEAAIRQADMAWAKAAEVNNFEGVMSYYTKDARVLVPNLPMAIGTEAIQKAIRPIYAPGVVVKWQPTHVEASRCGEIGYAQGNYEIATNAPKGKPAIERGKYVEIWKKQADGNWKCAVDVFNSD